MQIENSQLIGAACAIGGFVATNAFGWLKERFSKESDRKAAVVDEATKAIAGLTLAVTKLDLRMETLIKEVAELPRMNKDINEAHAKIREIAVKVDGENCR